MIRPTAAGDLEAILDLADTRRQQYADYQPRFWRPAPDAATRQAPYLAGLVADDPVLTAIAWTILDALH